MILTPPLNNLSSRTKTTVSLIRCPLSGVNLILKWCNMIWSPCKGGPVSKTYLRLIADCPNSNPPKNRLENISKNYLSSLTCLVKNNSFLAATVQWNSFFIHVTRSAAQNSWGCHVTWFRCLCGFYSSPLSSYMSPWTTIENIYIY